MIWQAVLALAAFIATPEQRPLGPPTGDNNEVSIHQQALENAELFGGDMLIEPEQFTTLDGAIVGEQYRWPGAVIPYVIDPSLALQRNLIESAMKHYHDNTCVRFVKRTTEQHYVMFFLGDGCYSHIGRIEITRQPLSLGIRCHNLGSVLHELGHVLGFFHEYNRSDRDGYLTINNQNIQEGQEFQFEKLNPNANILINQFDYDSIMMYGNYHFSKNPLLRLKTMEAKNGQALLEPYEKDKLTDSDIERVNTLYKCPAKSS